MPDNSYAKALRDKANKLNDVATMIECMSNNPDNYSIQEVTEYISKHKADFENINVFAGCFSEILKKFFPTADRVGIRTSNASSTDDDEIDDIICTKENLLYTLSIKDGTLTISDIYADVHETDNSDKEIISTLLKIAGNEKIHIQNFAVKK